MKIALGGGGEADDERPLAHVFAGWVGPAGKLLYWPIAMRGSVPFDACFDWIKATLGPLGVRDITMWSELSGHSRDELNSFDAVFIGGGNTYSLLSELVSSGFDAYLRIFIARGGAVYGGSAGAAILGRDIRTIEHMDSNTIGFERTDGLDVAMGHAVWVHYRPESDDERIHEYIAQYGHPVIAIAERSGVVLDKEGLRCVGYDPAYCVDPSGKKELERRT